MTMQTVAMYLRSALYNRIAFDVDSFVPHSTHVDTTLRNSVAQVIPKLGPLSRHRPSYRPSYAVPKRHRNLHYNIPRPFYEPSVTRMRALL